MTLSRSAASAPFRRLLAVSATISMGGLGVAALYHVLHDVSYRGLIDSLAAMSSWVIVAVLAATANPPIDIVAETAKRRRKRTDAVFLNRVTRRRFWPS